VPRVAAAAAAAAPACRKVVEEEPDPVQIAKDMERLALIKQRRCARQQRGFVLIVGVLKPPW
jgi:hypothetical protein